MAFGVKGRAFFVLFVGLTTPLFGNAILSLGSLNCTLTMPNPVSSTDCGPGGTNIALVSQLPQLATGLAGVSYTLSAPLTDTSIGTNAGVTSVVTLSTSGVPTGSGAVAAGTPVAMAWDFSLDFQFVEGHTQISDWTLAYDLRDVTAGNTSLFSSQPTINSGTLNISPLATPATFSGARTFNLSAPIDPSNGHVLQQFVVLTIHWTGQNNNSDNLMLQLAARGFDFNEAPEPATLALSGAALAAVVFFGRRRLVRQTRA